MRFPNYGSDRLFVAQSTKDGAILFASTSSAKMMKMYDEFKAKNPNTDLKVWFGYVNKMPDN